MAVETVSRPSVEEIFATGVSAPAAELESPDPAERMEFSRPSNQNVRRFDTRDDEELETVMRDHSDPLQRERALWEYGDRNGLASLNVLREVVHQEPTPAVRSAALWLLQKVGAYHAADAIAASLDDEHPEVRDWARLLLREITGRADERPQRRGFQFNPANPFDQTLPLVISGYARVLVPRMGWVQATLSPLWFESILGRVMACTREATFDTDLVIEKRLLGYHPDGTNHYEIFLFRGLSQHLGPGVCDHQYQARAQHTFYPSGKAEDESQPPLGDMQVELARLGRTTRIRVPGDPGRQVVESVRGRYMGTAFIKLDRIAANGMRIGPGEVQLASLHHPTAGRLTNTFLFGTFKGKLSDLDNDGLLDVNTERCHGTLTGELDYDLDGVADGDPYDPFRPNGRGA
jgi:hypothetical protein